MKKNDWLKSRTFDVSTWGGYKTYSARIGVHHNQLFFITEDQHDYSYVDYRDLMSFIKNDIEAVDLERASWTRFDRKTDVSFYGKETRAVKVGNDYFYVSGENKIELPAQSNLSNLLLALSLVEFYDSFKEFKPYGFNRVLTFRMGTRADQAFKIFKGFLQNYSDRKKKED